MSESKESLLTASEARAMSDNAKESIVKQKLQDFIGIIRTSALAGGNNAKMYFEHDGYDEPYENISEPYENISESLKSLGYNVNIDCYKHGDVLDHVIINVSW
jgi:hypothetical protein